MELCFGPLTYLFELRRDIDVNIEGASSNRDEQSIRVLVSENSYIIT
jgi:hypothetical protein